MFEQGVIWHFTRLNVQYQWHLWVINISVEKHPLNYASFQQIYYSVLSNQGILNISCWLGETLVARQDSLVFLGTVLEITMSPVKTSTEENSNNFHNLKPTSMLRECQLQILLTEPASESKPNPTPSRSDPNSLS